MLWHVIAQLISNSICAIFSAPRSH